MINQIFEQRRVQDGTELQFLPSDCRTDNRENSGANHRANSQRRQAKPAQRFLELPFRILRFRYELVDILRAEKLCAQSPPSR